MILTVPLDESWYPTLGEQVCAFIEENLIFGPGDLRGQPAVIDDEKRGLIFRFYEIHPQGHPQAGRRRFKRCGVSLRKGLAKTELAAWIAVCELHPEGPVRCDGWTKGGDPIGRPVIDPYIPLIAYTEEQSDELAFTAMRVMVEEGPLKDDFDIGLERILRKKGDGKAQSLSGSPNARDGARTTFQHFDETHRFTLQRLKDAHRTMLANIPKRKMADAWSLETTTAPEPGAGSIAEATMEYAEAIRDGKAADPYLFYFHRQAGDEHDLQTSDGARAAVVEASGAAIGWTDIESIMGLWNDPSADRAYWERVWCNRLVKGTTQAFDVTLWKQRAKPREIQDGRLITLGFDGGLFHDSTSLIATDVEDGYQWSEGLWECPPGKTDWQVPTQEVDAAVRSAFGRFNVWKLYADPQYWQGWLAIWAGEFTDKRVVAWWTGRRRPMTAALESFATAIKEGTIAHSGDPKVARHIGNARRLDLSQRDDQGKALWLIQKERPDSPHKIDAAMASVLSWQARTDAIAEGALTKAPEPTFQLWFVGGGRR